MRIGRSLVLFAFAATALTLTQRPTFAASVDDLLRIVERQTAQIAALTYRVDQLEARLGGGLDTKSPTIATRTQTEPRPQNAAVGADTVAVPVSPAGQVRRRAKEGLLEVKWGPSPTLEHSDAAFSAHVRGRVQADYGFADDTSGFDSTSATELRRARLGIEGTAWWDVDYKLEVDFADNEVAITDAYLQYNGVLKPGHLRLGQFKTPNSLDEQTSSSSTTFMERAAFTDAFAFDRRMGAAGGVKGDNWTAEAGIFGQEIGGDPDQDDTDGFDEGYALAARGTVATELGEDSLLHLGASTRYRNLNNDEDGGRVRYRQRPFIHTTDIRHVDTGSDGIPADWDLFAGAELAFVSGRFSAQAEVGVTWLDAVMYDDPWFWGGYVDMSYFLTDDTRPYRDGKFHRVKVKEPFVTMDGEVVGPGAWQVAGRLDYIDLSDGAIMGGEQLSAILGLNWHLNDHARLMLNYAYNRVEDGPPDQNGPDGDNVIHVVGARAQVDF